MPFNGINPNSIVVLDNCNDAIHHIDEVLATITSVEALVRFLPTYSPELNPVEEVFSQVKHWITMNDIVFQSTWDPRILFTMAFNEVTQENCLSYIKDRRRIFLFIID